MCMVSLILYPGVLKMINKINEFKNFNFLFSKNHNEVYYNDSKYLFSNGETVNSNFLMVENIEFQDHKSSEINSLFIDLSLKSSAFLPKSQIGVLVKVIIYYKNYKLIIQQFYDL